MARMTVSSDVRFAVVPEWLLDDDVSDRAVRLYAVLARHADKETGDAHPSRRRLAARCRCSADSIDRALKELVAVGAVSVEHRYSDDGDLTSNHYTVHVLRVGGRTGAATVAADERRRWPQECGDGGRTGAVENESQVNDSQLNESQGTHTACAVVDASPPERPRNAGWDAMVTAMGFQPVDTGVRKQWGAALKRLRAVGVTDEQIPALFDAYRRMWPKITCSPRAVANNAELLLHKAAEGDDGYSAEFRDIMTDDFGEP